MIRTAILAALALVCVASNAEARSRRFVIADPGCGVIFDCKGVVNSPRGEMIARKMQFGVAQKIYYPDDSGAREWPGQARPSVAPKRWRASPRSEIVPVVRPRKLAHRVNLVGGLTDTNFASGIIAKPARYIAGSLVCARNVGAALAERGIKGTGSALALSYLHWGRSAGGPVPGAVIVSARRGGGHVAIVSRVEHGVVYAWNATGGQSGWREIPYRLHVIDYRVPG